MQHWLRGDRYEHGGSGFMGKSWDSFVPGPEYWKAMYRIMAPGAYLLAFASTRTWDLMSMAIRFAGFENRDTIASFGGPPAACWTFGSGFPKSLDVSKAIDKAAGVEREVIGEKPDRWTNKGSVLNFATDRAQASVSVTGEPATPQPAAWRGYGTALKPAWEVVLVFRKPLGGTVAENCQEHGCGALNIDGSRVGWQKDDLDPKKNRAFSANSGLSSEAFQANSEGNLSPAIQRKALPAIERISPHGRWPANVVLSHSDGCRMAGVKKVKNLGGVPGAAPKDASHPTFTSGDRTSQVHHFDGDGTETVEAWECDEGCAVRLLDEQSGALVTHGGGFGDHKSRSAFGGGRVSPETQPTNDRGGASRFFYTAKASRKERNAGCEDLPESDALVGANIVKSCNNCGSKITVHPGGGLSCPCGKTEPTLTKVAQKARANGHPTVKPLKLAEYLARLILPAQAAAPRRILVPFAGSGSEMIGAMLAGWDEVVGIEQSEEYVKIAEARIAHWKKQMEGEQPSLPLAA